MPLPSDSGSLKLSVFECKTKMLAELGAVVNKRRADGLPATEAATALQLCRTCWSEFESVSTLPSDTQNTLRISENATFRARIADDEATLSDLSLMLFNRKSINPTENSLVNLKAGVLRLHRELYDVTHRKEFGPAPSTWLPAAEDSTRIDISIESMCKLAEQKQLAAARHVLKRRIQNNEVGSVDVEEALREMSEGLQVQLSRTQRLLEEERIANIATAKALHEDMLKSDTRYEAAMSEMKRRHQRAIDKLQTAIAEQQVASIQNASEMWEHIMIEYATRLSGYRGSDLSRAHAMETLKEVLMSERIKIEGIYEIPDADMQTEEIIEVEAQLHQQPTQIIEQPRLSGGLSDDPHAPWTEEAANHPAVLNKLFRGQQAELNILLAGHRATLKARSLEWETELRSVVAKYEAMIAHLRATTPKAAVDDLNAQVEALTSELDEMKQRYSILLKESLERQEGGNARRRSDESRVPVANKSCQTTEAFTRQGLTVSDGRTRSASMTSTTKEEASFLASSVGASELTTTVRQVKASGDTPKAAGSAVRALSISSNSNPIAENRSPGRRPVSTTKLQVVDADSNVTAVSIPIASLTEKEQNPNRRKSDIKPDAVDQGLASKSISGSKRGSTVSGHTTKVTQGKGKSPGGQVQEQEGANGSVVESDKHATSVRGNMASPSQAVGRDEPGIATTRGNMSKGDDLIQRTADGHLHNVFTSSSVVPGDALDAHIKERLGEHHIHAVLHPGKSHSDTEDVSNAVPGPPCDSTSLPQRSVETHESLQAYAMPTPASDTVTQVDQLQAGLTHTLTSPNQKPTEEPSLLSSEGQQLTRTTVTPDGHGAQNTAALDPQALSEEQLHALFSPLPASKGLYINEVLPAVLPPATLFEAYPRLIGQEKFYSTLCQCATVLEFNSPSKGGSDNHHKRLKVFVPLPFIKEAQRNPLRPVARIEAIAMIQSCASVSNGLAESTSSNPRCGPALGALKMAMQHLLHTAITLGVPHSLTEVHFGEVLSYLQAPRTSPILGPNSIRPLFNCLVEIPRLWHEVRLMAGTDSATFEAPSAIAPRPPVLTVSNRSAGRLVADRPGSARYIHHFVVAQNLKNSVRGPL